MRYSQFWDFRGEKTAYFANSDYYNQCYLINVCHDVFDIGRKDKNK